MMLGIEPRTFYLLYRQAISLTMNLMKFSYCSPKVTYESFNYVSIFFLLPKIVPRTSCMLESAVPFGYSPAPHLKTFLLCFSSGCNQTR